MYIIWSICKQFPNYLTSLAYKAVRMLGSMCSAQWFHHCYLCVDFILSETVQYYTKLNQFRDALWQKLLAYVKLTRKTNRFVIFWLYGYFERGEGHH